MSLDVLIRDAIRNQVNDRRLRALDDSQATFDAVDVDTLAPWSYDLLMLSTSLRAFAVRPDGHAPNSVETSALSAAQFAATVGPRDDEEDEEDDDMDGEDDDLEEDDFEDEDEEEAEDESEVSLEELEKEEDDEAESDDFGAMDDEDDDDLDWDEDEDEDDDLFDEDDEED